MMTNKELLDDFWLLTNSVLEDSRIETHDARVI
jgi:hypothetical protein